MNTDDLTTRLVQGRTLAHAALPASGMRRASKLSAKYQREGYMQAFDATTLWYDAIWRDGIVHLVCPKLNNLKAEVQKGAFTLDGMPVRIKRLRRFYRHDIIELPFTTCPTEVRLKAFGTTISSPVNGQETAPFAGLNAALCLSKNNDLRWITDFAQFHVEQHGLEALILMDNGSTDYGISDIEDALSLTDLKRIMVVSTPRPYGPRGRAPYARTEKYLQTALFNVLRLRWLGQARAVLSCDIDELVHTPGTTIFDMALKSWGGFVRVPGYWRYPDPEAADPSLHASHTHLKSSDKPCPTKWCINPAGPLGGFQWDTHLLERLPLPSLFTNKQGKFWHCRSTTTGWKSNRNAKQETGLQPDRETAEVLAQVFNPPA
ncbi:hypothetical protein [Donghicola mangrovi]|uniref:Uncharacterized protein n=1 Tax=Donghicola mangrovi TaxID=2729614 RepID=A0A850Q6L2_9RHOB|nr:hypothetical protein [Donghicola mangrovi]NVO22009.1 hypothetical protein [Donghicola mangrovi]